MVGSIFKVKDGQADGPQKRGRTYTNVAHSRIQKKTSKGHYLPRVQERAQR